MDSQDQITYLGRVDHRNKLTKFGIKPRDRTKHMYIIGKTGTGKSTFLENMIVQDIQNGHGVAFIDPHGGSASKLLDYIPEWRLDDVIYFDPSDFDFPLAFNPLEDPGPEKRHLVSDGLMSVFKKVWPDAFSGRMEYILNTVMMSLLEFPDSTVLSINRMLTDKDFRKRVVASVTDSAVKNAWDELMKWDDKRWSEAVAALINKVGQFSTNPVIRNILGQPKSTFDFRKAMDERKIIIMNLSKGMIGEQNAPLLGAMLITKIYLAAMSRAELSQQVIENSAPFYFYVDEFQNFANESFASILSEARKYKLCLTIANQFIAQMEEPIRDAVFGNMGTTIAFRVGTLDAEFMEKVFAPVFTQEDLQNIAFAQMYLTLQIDNMGSKPFSAKALDPIPPLQTSMRTQVIERSRHNFGRPRLEVEAAIQEFFGYGKKDGAKVISSDTVRPQKPNNTTNTPKRNDVYRAPITPQKPKPPAPKNSDSLNDLLGKLDAAVVKDMPAPTPNPIEEKPVAPIIAPPTIEAKEVVRPQAQPQVQNTPKPKPSEPRVFKNDLSRAASPEKKNALQEALAKAMAGNKTPPSASQYTPSERGGTESKPIQESVQTEKISTNVTPEPVRVADANSFAAKQERVAPPEEKGSGTPIPTYTQSKTIREVPEDILRKTLE
jgi:DNA segregation ATPase FtsK/SpoIIIE-like protein